MVEKEVDMLVFIDDSEMVDVHWRRFIFLSIVRRSVDVVGAEVDNMRR